jgi:hypothetical protein
MTLAAPIRPNRLRRARAAKTGHAASTATAAVCAQHVLSVEFTSVDGRSWTAIGGGGTFAAAIAVARESCPTDATWHPVRWNDLYGD